MPPEYRPFVVPEAMMVELIQLISMSSRSYVAKRLIVITEDIRRPEPSPRSTVEYISSTSTRVNFYLVAPCLALNMSQEMHKIICNCLIHCQRNFVAVYEEVLKMFYLNNLEYNSNMRLATQYLLRHRNKLTQFFIERTL